MEDAAKGADARERAWWLRALLVLGDPTVAFRALRDVSPEAESARQEPVTAIAFLFGIATALRAAAGSELLDDPDFDALTVAVWTVAAGGVQGFFAYWVLGAALYAGMSAVGDPGTYRQARHLLAYALVPVVLSLLVVWPLRLAVEGGDVFRRGAEGGAVSVALAALEAALYVWSAVLLVVGVRVVRELTWARALAATSVGVGVLVGGVIALALVL
jgi:hypothetical protein